jgi:hypothetical protein
MLLVGGLEHGWIMPFHILGMMDNTGLMVLMDFSIYWED